ncbi:MAG: hypothetical protein MI919_38890, partial [Holophagales bacterium]|nr:hypothetical protein [Holophagales bacterium]
MSPQVVAGVALLLSILPLGVAAQGFVDPLTAGEPLVLSFRQGRMQMTDGVLAFRGSEGGVFLPLDEVCRGVGFAIDVDVPGRRAEGFYLSEENGFVLDIAEGSVESAGKRFEISEGSVLIGEMDLFVELSVLDGWLEKVDLIYHSSTPTVEVKSDPPLPAV